MIRQSTIDKQLGKHYYFYEVIEFSHKRGCSYIYRCRCRCGVERLVDIAEIKRGRTKSCGCYRVAVVEGGDRRRKGLGEAAKNAVYAEYSARAKKKGLKFELSIEDFEDIITSRCYFCGALFGNKRGNKNTYGNFEYTGIDRVDNSKGYIKDNSIPCCTDCNMKKGAITKDMVYKLYRLFEGERQ